MARLRKAARIWGNPKARAIGERVLFTPDGNIFAIDPPAALLAHLDPDPVPQPEPSFQPLNSLAEPALEPIPSEVQVPEASSFEETQGAHQHAAASSPFWQTSEEPVPEPEPASSPLESLEQDGLSPEDMWNAGSIVHSNLDRPSAGSSDADMRASDERSSEKMDHASLPGPISAAFGNTSHTSSTMMADVIFCAVSSSARLIAELQQAIRI